MSDLAMLLRGSPYQAYAYAYPHKTAYRRLDPPRNLAEVWRNERQEALFLYVHIPFCEMRCGFCNLFTQSQTRAGMPVESELRYIAALERQARVVRAALPAVRFAGGAIGGGTPTFFSAPALERLLTLFRELFGNGNAGQVSVEASPFTATPERLALLRAFGVTRLSLGVQSFIPTEVAASGRAQTLAEVECALNAIRAAQFPVLNIDLIYGLPGQTVATWLESLRAALRWAPEELYLYPLYVRPLTGLGLRAGADADPEWDKLRLVCYREGRALLLASGYRALSMRHFRRNSLAEECGDYCCQEDGTVALGCGGRSYTRALHYSSEYAVSGEGVREITQRFIAAPDSEHGLVSYGFELDSNEERRRYVIKSLLRSTGLDYQAYATFFGSSASEDLPALRELLALGLAADDGTQLRPTERGLEYSDVIGPWLASAAVRERMQAYSLR